jgi:hypothetical protein
MVNPAPLLSALEEVAAYAPSKPSNMAFALLVLTPVTVGTALKVLVATAGSAPLASQGDPVLAPETPKATMEASSAVPERFTVMLAELNAEDAMAYQTSTSR